MRRPAVPSGRLPAVWGRLLSAGALTRRETLLCAAFLTALAAIVFGPHVMHGGFLMDDWSNAAKSRYLASCCGRGVTGEGIGWYGQFNTLLNDGPAAYHLGLPVVIPPVYFLLGIHMHLHLALAVLLGVGMSLGAYVLMRRMGLAPLHAAAISALVLVFPYSDSTRLWAMAGFNQLAVILWLLGVYVARRGLGAAGVRRQAVWHLGALALYFTAICTYELAGGLVVISALFYLGRGTWRQALARFPADAIVAYGALAFVKANTLYRPVLPFKLAWLHVRNIADEAITMLRLTAFPFSNDVSRYVVGGVILAALVAGVAGWARLGRDDPLRAALRRWVAVAGVGAVVVFAGYLSLVPATYGGPLAPGIENRVNMISAFGYIAIAYAAVAVAASLALRALRRPRALAIAAAVPAVFALAIGVSYAAKSAKDGKAYDAAYRQGQHVMTQISHAVGVHPPRGATIYAYDFPTFTEPGVPVFAWVWDMPSAIKVAFDDPSLAGFPIFPGTSWQCQRKQMYPISGFGTGPGEWGPYGNTYMVDVERGTAQRIDTRAECAALPQQSYGAPVKAGSSCRLIGAGPATRLYWSCGNRVLPDFGS